MATSSQRQQPLKPVPTAKITTQQRPVNQRLMNCVPVGRPTQAQKRTNCWVAIVWRSLIEVNSILGGR